MRLNLIAPLFLFAFTVSAHAQVTPVYIGTEQEKADLESTLKADVPSGKQVVCTDLIFVRNSGSLSVTIAGMCAVDGTEPQLACSNASAKKHAVAPKSYPELTKESELLSLIADKCTSK